MLHLDGRQWLRLDSYVGVLESPCGQIIEILPKTHDAAPDENMVSEVSRSRRMLKKMLASAMDLPLREAEEAGLELGEGSLSEWVMGRFLCEAGASGQARVAF